MDRLMHSAHSREFVQLESAVCFRPSFTHSGARRNPFRRRHFLCLGISIAGLALVSGCGPTPFEPQSRVARVGHLWSGTPLGAPQTDAFRAGMRDAGWIDGQNVVISERTYG